MTKLYYTWQGLTFIFTFPTRLINVIAIILDMFCNCYFFLCLDPQTLADIERMKKPLERTRAKIVGSTAVMLEGDPAQCRVRECNTGKSKQEQKHTSYDRMNSPYKNVWSLAVTCGSTILRL